MKLLRKEDGSSLIEISLLLPLLIFVFLGAVDFSLIIQRSMVVTDAATSGARFGTVAGNGNNTAGMQTAAQSAAVGVSGFTATASDYCTCVTAGGTVNCTVMCSPSVTPAQYVKVLTSATVPLLFNVKGLPASYNMSASSVMRVAWTGQ